jgi:hypothetical protein
MFVHQLPHAQPPSEHLFLLYEHHLILMKFREKDAPNFPAVNATDDDMVHCLWKLMLIFTNYCLFLFLEMNQ